MKYKVYILASASLAMAIFLLFHFGAIWVYGKFYIFENNIAILTSETVLIITIMIFSFYCLFEQLRKYK